MTGITVSTQNPVRPDPSTGSGLKANIEAPVGANLFARLSTLAHAIKKRANKFAPTKTASIQNTVRPELVKGQTSPAPSPSTGSGRTGEGKLNEALLLALARLPWLRHGYMPNWLRLALLHNLAPAAEQSIRAQLAELLKTMLHGQAAQAQDLTLAIAQQSPSNVLKHLLPAWWKHSETLSQDYVFQSFMANRLAVRTQNPLPQHPRRVLLGELLVLGVVGYFAWFAVKPMPPSAPPVVSPTQPASAVSPTPRPSQVALASPVLPASPVQPAPVLPASPVPPTPPKIKPASPVVAAPVAAVSTVQNNAPIAPQQQTAQQIQAPQPTTTFTLDMVNIPAGSFTMGCQSGRDSSCYSDEKPAHTVQISAFQLGKTEVTQGQWQAVMGSNPSHFKDCGDNCPVEQVSWDEVQVFIKKLNEQTSKTYRLPSEAEWEYACRAGQDTQYCGSNDVNAVAWYDGNSGSKSHPVGGKKANAWGLYDMNGNVWEWVQDSWHGDYNNAPTNGSAWLGTESVGRVRRGGSWDGDTWGTRAAIRFISTLSGRFGSVGFRLARTLP